MKLDGRRLSDNVEVNCLGLTANLSGPAGDAAWACYNEVQNLRQTYTNPEHPLMNTAVFGVEVKKVIRAAEASEEENAQTKSLVGRDDVTDPLAFIIRADELREALERRVRGGEE